MTDVPRTRLDWLSDEWFAFITELGSKLPPMEGVTARVQYRIVDSPVGTASFYDDIRDGRAHRVGRGEVEHPDAEITLGYAEFKQLILENRSSEHFTTRKVTGDLEKLARIQAAHERPEYRAMREHYLDVVSFPDEEQGR